MKKNFELRVIQTFDCDTREEAIDIARACKEAHAAFIEKKGARTAVMRCDLVSAAPKAIDSETVEGQPIPKVATSGRVAVVVDHVPIKRTRVSVIEKIDGCTGDGMDASSKAKLS